jgi:hypothetical protein
VSEADPVLARVKAFADQLLQEGHNPRQIGTALGAAGIATMSQFAGEDVVLRFLTMAIEAVRKEGSGGRGLPN